MIKEDDRRLGIIPIMSKFMGIVVAVIIFIGMLKAYTRFNIGEIQTYKYIYYAAVVFSFWAITATIKNFIMYFIITKTKLVEMTGEYISYDLKGKLTLKDEDGDKIYFVIYNSTATDEEFFNEIRHKYRPTIHVKFNRHTMEIFDYKEV